LSFSRRLLLLLAILAAALATAGVALADNCYNASRPGGDLSTNPADFSAPVFKGRWVWLPSVGAPLPAWGFDVPENYLNSGGAEAWLLENTPYCEAGGVLFYNGPRTTENGAQSGCGFFG
jgi:hypothetical protein